MRMGIPRCILHPFSYREELLVDRILARHVREQRRAEQIAAEYGPAPVISGHAATVRYDPATGFTYDEATGSRVDRRYDTGNPYPGAREDGYRTLAEVSRERRTDLTEP